MCIRRYAADKENILKTYLSYQIQMQIALTASIPCEHLNKNLEYVYNALDIVK